jgi:DNA adenine methylase
VIGPLAYIGGKRRLAPTIVALLPPHTTYVEPFAGGAQVLFHKPPSPVEVLNDLDEEIVNFFRILQRHPRELSRILRWQPMSRRLFEWELDRPPPGATDVERAARFFYLQKHAWSGKRTRRSFRYGVQHSPRTSPESIPKKLTQVAHRLDGVQLECLPYEDILKRYDRPSTVFYCDPPYVDVNLYQHNFTDEQFEGLVAALRRLQGRFLLSINDCPKSRQWFAEFHIQTVQLTYTSTRAPRRFSELLIANYPLVTPTPP